MAEKVPKLAVWKFASCDGCQLSLLDLEDQLLDIADRLQVSYFLEASHAQISGPYDLSLVEGSITTPQDADRIRQVRAASKYLVTIGACATAGGIQALRNFREIGSDASLCESRNRSAVDGFLSLVYATPAYIDTLATSTAIAENVPVDFELQGCPINKKQLLEVLSAFLAGRKPAIGSYSVCVECKRKGNVCVMVAHGTACMGPVTHAGCDALCPTYDRGCYGCYGPMEAPNTASLSRAFASGGIDEAGLVRVFRTFNANAPAFRAESAKHAR